MVHFLVGCGELEKDWQVLVDEVHTITGLNQIGK